MTYEEEMTPQRCPECRKLWSDRRQEPVPGLFDCDICNQPITGPRAERMAELGQIEKEGDVFFFLRRPEQHEGRAACSACKWTKDKKEGLK